MSYPLAPALRGEGRGEGSSLRNEISYADSNSAIPDRTEWGCEGCTSAEAFEEPLTLTLSPQGRGEGTGNVSAMVAPQSEEHCARRRACSGTVLTDPRA